MNNAELIKQEIVKTTKEVNSYLDKNLWPPKHLEIKLDDLLKTYGAIKQEIEYGPNVLLFDQNLRRKRLVHRKYSQDAQVINFTEFKARKGK